MMPTPLIRKRLLSIPAFAARLGTYDFGADAPEPAIFSVSPAPSDARGIIAIISRESSVDDLGGRKNRIARYAYKLTIWGERDHSYATLNELGLVAYRELHGLNGAIDANRALVNITADPPAETRDDDGYPGVEIGLSATVKEN